MSSPLIHQLFEYVNYYHYAEGITGYYMCLLKKNLCPDLLAGQIVNDIVIYSDGNMDVFFGYAKYRFQLALFVEAFHTGTQCITT